jgi:inner membrane transporter RhtA
MESCNSYGLCLGHEFDFYLAIERIPIGLAVTLEFIGPLLVAVFWLKTFCRLFMGTLQQQNLIAPWTNNGINVLGVLFALLAGAFGLLYRPGRKVSKIMKDGAVATGMLFASINCAFGIMGNGFSNLNNISFFRVALALLSSAIPFTLEMQHQLPVI